MVVSGSKEAVVKKKKAGLIFDKRNHEFMIDIKSVRPKLIF